MSISVTRREHVLVSYGILFTLTAISSFFGLREAIAGRVAFFSQLEQLRSVHARSLQAMESSRAAREALARAGDRARGGADFLEAETDALAAADLQNKIKAIVEAEGGTLVSSAFRRASPPLPLTPVSVIVRLRCSVEALARILHSLEQHEPPLFTEDVSIQSRHRPGRPLQDVNDELDVEFSVTGYLDRALEP